MPLEATVRTVLARHANQPQALVQILRELQAEQGWLPREALMAVAQATGRTVADVEGVASFYRFLHLVPVGRYRVLFSDNITDRMQGSVALMERLCRRLGVAPGAVRADGRVSVAPCSCTGLGDQGPALLINHHQVITRLTEERVDAIADCIERQLPPAQWPAEWMQVEDPVHRADVLLGTPFAPGSALQAARALGRNGTLEQVQRSGLRGRGGAGFATGLKWELCRDAPGAQRCVVCNADEGEPGTFKDRVLLRRHAHLVVEGMTLAAWAVGARRGFIYLRGEYRFLLEHLQEVLRQRRAAGLLGPDIQGEAGFDFDIEIHVGAGAYVCGEESALLNSLEGHRGTPRIRPPFPVEVGYLGQPTTVNNVETFCAVAHILLRGGTGGPAWARPSPPAPRFTPSRATVRGRACTSTRWAPLSSGCWRTAGPPTPRRSRWAAHRAPACR